MSVIDDEVMKWPEEARREYYDALLAIEVDGFSRPNLWLSVRGFKPGYDRERVKEALYEEMHVGNFTRAEQNRRKN